MLRYTVLFLLVIISVRYAASAQKHDYQWALGQSTNFSEYRFFYNFNDPVPSVAIRPDTMSTGIFTSSYCDAAGNILFYSNGLWLLNKWGELVENSMGLNPTLPEWQTYSYQGGQSGFFLASPGDSNIVYLITLDFGPHPVHLWPYYYVGKNLTVATIDRTANNGAGKVLQKNQILLTGTLMSPAACRHANGRDWWILVSDADKNKHYRILLSPAGFSAAETQNIGTKPNPIPYDQGNSNNFISGNCFSPSGKYYADINDYRGFSIFSFDRCSGLLSSERRINYLPNPAYPKYHRNKPGSGAVFSSNDRFFYKTSTLKVAISPVIDVGTFAYLVQYDLAYPDLSMHADTINTIDSADYHFPENITWNAFLGAEMGPDGRIYVVHTGSSYCSLQYPNVPGKAARFVHDSPNFGVAISSGIPYMPNYRLGPLDGSVCDTLGIDNVPVAHFRVDDTLGVLSRYFYDLSHHEPAHWSWDFDDGTSSTDTSALHTFPAPGLYHVCLTVSNDYGSHTECTPVWVGITSTGSPASLPESVQVLPNPFGTHLDVVLQAPLTQPVFRLYDALGRLQRQENLSGASTRISTEPLAPGLYFWEVRAQGRRVQAGKVLKG